MAGGFTRHQRLTVGQGHIKASVTALSDTNISVLAQLTHQLFAVVAQGRSIVAGGFGLHDFLVEQRQVVGQTIDFRAHGRALLMQGLGLVIDAGVQPIETLREIFHLGQNLLAHRDIAGAVTGRAQGRVKVIEPGAQVCALA